MPLKIVRNDITKMKTQAIVNTANEHPIVGFGCDEAIYMAAGYDKLLSYRKEKIGSVPEGGAFITPGFKLHAKYIIHAVSPEYKGGDCGEEEKLRSCYQKSLMLAKENNIKSIAFPLVSTGQFGYPKEEGMRIALDEINAFLADYHSDMLVYIVVYDEKSTMISKNIYPDLESYIDDNYIDEKNHFIANVFGACAQAIKPYRRASMPTASMSVMPRKSVRDEDCEEAIEEAIEEVIEESIEEVFDEKHKSKLDERIEHLSDTYSQYLLYLIEKKNLKNADVWRNAIVDKKVFSKIKNNIDYHPQKMTALCLCVGARLNLDETKDLLAKAGYALSPCDKTDIIFSYFIENEIYDMIELDIQLEEHGLPCLIS